MGKMGEKDLLELWFYTNDLADSTQEIYTRVLKQYSNYLGKSIKEIYEEAIQEEKGNVFFHERQYRADLIKYNNYLKKEGRSLNTRKLHTATIKSFFEAQGIREPKIKFKRGNHGKKENWGHLLTKEEINKLIEVANPRNKALIKTMALTGMSQKEAREFKIKDILSSVSNELKQRVHTVEELFKIEKELENKVLTLKMRREKASYDYITFLPPEALRAIIVYLKERQYGRNKKIRIKDTNSPIFLTKDGNLLDVGSIAAAFAAATKRAGLDIDHEHGTYRSSRSHGMRRYFISTIMNKLHLHTEADFMAGHKISEQDATYWRSDPKELKKVYMAALPYLSLENVKVKTITTEDKERLEILEEKNQFYDDAKPFLEFLMQDPETQERFKDYMDQK